MFEALVISGVFVDEKSKSKNILVKPRIVIIEHVVSLIGSILCLIGIGIYMAVATNFFAGTAPATIQPILILVVISSVVCLISSIIGLYYRHQGIG